MTLSAELYFTITQGEFFAQVPGDLPPVVLLHDVWVAPRGQDHRGDVDLRLRGRHPLRRLHQGPLHRAPVHQSGQ